jgi:hypothetical protein
MIPVRCHVLSAGLSNCSDSRRKFRFCSGTGCGLQPRERISKPGQAPLHLLDLQEITTSAGSQSRFWNHLYSAPRKRHSDQQRIGTTRPCTVTCHIESLRSRNANEHGKGDSGNSQSVSADRRQYRHRMRMAVFDAKRVPEFLGNPLFFALGRGGIEPPTPGFSVLCSTN